MRWCPDKIKCSVCNGWLRAQKPDLAKKLFGEGPDKARNLTSLLTVRDRMRFRPLRARPRLPASTCLRRGRGRHQHVAPFFSRYSNRRMLKKLFLNYSLRAEKP